MASSSHAQPGESSPGTTLAAVAADRLTIAVAFLDNHADVGLHQLGNVHDLQRKRSRVHDDVSGKLVFHSIACMLF